MFFIVEQFFPAFIMQANATHEPACPIVGVSDAIEAVGEPACAVRCNKDLIEEALFERRRDLFTEVLDPLGASHGLCSLSAGRIAPVSMNLHVGAVQKVPPRN